MYQRPDRRDKGDAAHQPNSQGRRREEGAGQRRNLLWAGEWRPRCLSTTKEYQNLMKAEKLLASNSQDGNLLIEDKLAMAEILAPRPEPLSRLKAIELAGRS